MLEKTILPTEPQPLPNLIGILADEMLLIFIVFSFAYFSPYQVSCLVIRQVVVQLELEEPRELQTYGSDSHKDEVHVVWLARDQGLADGLVALG